MSFFLTPYTLTLVLAYLHHYTCKFLPGRALPMTHLRNLAAWLGAPDANLRTARRHPTLAIHLALAHTAGLVDTESGLWVCLPSLFTWLGKDHLAQSNDLLAAWQDEIARQSILERLNLRDALPIDTQVYWQQRLERQKTETPPPTGLARWLTNDNEDQWLLDLPHWPVAQTGPTQSKREAAGRGAESPATLLPRTLFHLLQLGEWMPGRPLAITPISLANAAHRGYAAPTTVEGILAAATGQPLSDAQNKRLLDWFERQGAVRLRPVYLLSTRQPEQMATIAANRRLRNRFRRQLSPRQAIVSPRLAGSLQRWLAKQGIPLTLSPELDPQRDLDQEIDWNPHPAYLWLGLRLIASLEELIPTAISLPYSALEAVEAQLTPTQKEDLDLIAEQLLENIQAAIRGQDAFFPAAKPADSQLLAAIQQAMIEERLLEIAYQALGDSRASRRQVEPLRLERRGELYYLHAYCYRAEANRVFRLDRIHDYRLL